MRKILTFISAALLASLSAAATLSPVSLLNPAGSTAGQAIVSTGASTPPAWATVVAGSLTPVGANTVIGNFTGSSASPLANAIPSCSTANSALKYTTSTGLSCGTTFALTSGNLSQFASTTSAQLAGVLSDETGTGVAVFSASPTFTGTVNTEALTATGAITPSQTAGIVGTTTNNDANAGSWGEYLPATAAGVSISTSTATNCTSRVLTAGDWDVYGSITFSPAGTTTVQTVQAGLSTTSATMPGAGNVWTVQGSLTTGASQSGAVPYQRISTTGTTVYLVGLSVFGVSTMTMTCKIDARRAR